MTEYIKRLEAVVKRGGSRIADIEDLRSLLSDYERMRGALEGLMYAVNFRDAALCADGGIVHLQDAAHRVQHAMDEARQALSEGMGRASVVSRASALHGRATDGGVKLEGEG